MNTFNINSIITFTARELRRLRIFKRTRDLWSKKKSIKITTSNINIYSCILYGTRDTLSPNQRGLLREQVMNILHKQNQQYSSIVKNNTKIDIQISLFSGLMNQQQNIFTYLSTIRNILQGTTFQRVIKLPFLVENKYNWFSQIKNRVSIIETLKSVSIKPSIIYIPTKISTILPIRIDQLNKIEIKNEVQFFIIFQLCNYLLKPIFIYSRNKFNYFLISNINKIIFINKIKII